MEATTPTPSPTGPCTYCWSLRPCKAVLTTGDLGPNRPYKDLFPLLLFTNKSMLGPVDLFYTFLNVTPTLTPARACTTQYKHSKHIIHNFTVDTHANAAYMHAHEHNMTNIARKRTHG